MYTASVTYNQGTEREFSYETVCFSLQDAVDIIELWARGTQAFRAWINNKEANIMHGRVIDECGNLFCTDEYWHANLAKPYQRVMPMFTDAV